MDAKKIRWKCRRGMLELDLILFSFFEKQYSRLTSAEQLMFNDLLDQDDPDLYNFLLGYAKPKDTNLQQIVKIIRDFNKV